LPAAPHDGKVAPKGSTMGHLHHAEPSRSAARTATGRVVGRVAELWRYPVKSMLGGTVPQLLITDRGGLGDRAWALRDPASGRIASAKRFPRLLEFRSTYEVEPTQTSPGRVRIEAPDGRTVYADQPEASELVSSILGRVLRLENQARPAEKTGIDRSTVFGDVPVSDMKPDWTPETMPDYFQLKTGTFFEIGAVYLLGSGSVAHLRELQGGTALIDRRRFRPNIYIDTGPETDRFVEDEWVGRTLAVGATLVLNEFQPTLWCVTSTLAQEELPRDRSVLRTTAQHHKGCLGVYASVRAAGQVRVGDPVVLL
jgi:MOSC domain-containing protein